MRTKRFTLSVWRATQPVVFCSVAGLSKIEIRHLRRGHLRRFQNNYMQTGAPLGMAEEKEKEIREETQDGAAQSMPEQSNAVNGSEEDGQDTSGAVQETGEAPAGEEEPRLPDDAKGTPDDKKPDKKKLAWILIAIAAAVIAVIAIVQVVSAQLAQQESIDAYQHIVSTDTSKTKVRAVETADSETVDKDGKRPSDRDIDFADLQATNEDIIAWISIPGTQIDYPIVKTDDNEYYLDHDAFKKESKEGAIFTDMGNNTDFSDPNTVIYGHNMKSGTMFAGLHQYEDEAFLKENGVVKIYVPDGMYLYDIFAVRTVGDGNILYENDFTKKEVFQEYLDGILSADEEDAIVVDGETPNTDSKIITLSTCIQNEPEKRLIVEAVLKLG